jgi:hypothetical protein
MGFGPSGSSGQSSGRLVQAVDSFADARGALVQLIENLTFVSVVSVQQSKGSYYGEAIELQFRDTRERPALIFFDKFGRSRSMITIGPIRLAQAPLGHDHHSSVPSVGEILVGSMVPNTRSGSHLSQVLRGWSSDAKPLKELLRLLKFGTRTSEFEARSLLMQSSCLLMQCPPDIRKSRDDIYMVARAILWANVRPLQILASIEEPERYKLKKEATEEELSAAKSARISYKASEFVDLLIVKLSDAKLSEAFMDGLEYQRPKTPEYRPKTPEYNAYQAYDPAAYNPPTTASNLAAFVAYQKMPAYTFAPVQPETYMPSSPMSPKSPASPMPPYAPASPHASPHASPMPYAPVSPENPPSPEYAPSSPIEN